MPAVWAMMDRWWWGRTRPIFVGPFWSELGFEALYWLPWLQSWRERYKIDKDRLVIISRGGTGHWYDAGQTVELYDYVPVSDLRLAAHRNHKAQASLKQLGVQSWERHVCAMVADRLQIKRYRVIHPSTMYQALMPFWQGEAALKPTLQRLTYLKRLPTPQLPVGLELPSKFIAVRFYNRATWPLNDETQLWTEHLVSEIAKRLPVVVLGSSHHADEHIDMPLRGPNILDLTDKFPFRENLGLQSAVLAKANGFVGTYGGMMQLAVQLNVPSVGFYLQFGGTMYAHKMLTEWLGTQKKLPVFICRPEDAAYVQSVVSAPLDIPKALPSSS